MRINDALIGAVLLVFAGAVFAYARTLPAIPGQEYGAAVFPMLNAIGLGGCGLLLVASGMRHWQGAVEWNSWARTHHAWGKLAAVVALILVYIFATPVAGFLPTSFAILLIFLLMMRVHWWLAILVALGTSVLIQQTFSGLLRVPLPLGPFGPW
jgi:putative tricarboxylic transport membrane protein